MYNTSNIDYRGGGVNLSLSCESFLDYAYEGEEALEASKKWGNKEKKFYNKVQFALNNPIGNMNQIIAQKNECKKRLKRAEGNLNELENFDAWLDKQIALSKRLLNSKTPSKRKFGASAIDLYQKYKNEIAKRLD